MVLYTIVGYTGCGHYDRAVKCGQTLVANHPEEVKLKLKGTGKDEFLEYLHLQHKGLQHFTSPAVWKGKQPSVRMQLKTAHTSVLDRDSNAFLLCVCVSCFYIRNA